ncbi:MAG: 1-deoxy-D-xylulose-5-phosphate synthase [Oscillospiraceae bacterium]|nr:1-deoxy-D-xylulose-5-phosphate synthase [Oscillospiraceae bacterium]
MSEQLELHNMTDEQAVRLCADLRKQLVDSVSRTGGHLASNLGAVELTVALHRVFDLEKDRLVFDVGHQCYIHKMLTGRSEQMETMRQFGGLAGFPKPGESDTDAFVAGHASNSVSVAVGMAQARTVLGQDYHVIALIGDGALTGGLAYEGLSNAGQSKENLLVILNDNGMSITQNVGGVAEYLARKRLRPQYLAIKKRYRKFMNLTAVGRKFYSVTHKLKKMVREGILPCSMFEDMGFSYMGPVNGHDVKGLTEILQYAKEKEGPVLLHVRTVKGKGYTHAEERPNKFHGVAPFDIATGQPLKRGGENFSAVFGKTLCDIADEDSRVCAVTAAMQNGTGLDGFAQRFPERFFDVGIAEGHAVAMAAGMAKQGAIPVFAVYSTFLQRGYDMLMHDVAIQGLHTVFAVDRAGLVGEDGETHHGVLDVAYLDSIPGMTVLAPSSYAELEGMLRRGIEECSGPVAVRFPRGGQGAYTADSSRDPAVVLRRGSDITLVSYGMLINRVLEAADLLEQQGISAEIVKLNAITPLDAQLVIESVARTGAMLVAEDCVSAGSVGQRLSAALAQAGVQAKIVLRNSGNGFVAHGSTPLLEQTLGLDGKSLCNTAREVLTNG